MEFEGAIDTIDLPLWLIELGSFTVSAVNQAGLSKARQSASAVLGRRLADFLLPRDADAAERALGALREGQIDFFRSAMGDGAHPGAPPAVVWVRAVEIDGSRSALMEVGDEPGPGPLARYLGLEPLHMAVGTIDSGWTIKSVSSEIVHLLGIGPDEAMGQTVLRPAEQRSVEDLLGAGGPDFTIAVPVTLRGGYQQSVRLCLVVSGLANSDDRLFMLLNTADSGSDSYAARAQQLERHLWRIAAEVEASGVLRRLRSLPEPAQVEQLQSLSSRQWEIVTRLMRGERVATIAKEMFLSQSTVRNHLSAVFERFGVHSQAELLEMLRPKLNTEHDGT